MRENTRDQTTGSLSLSRPRLGAGESPPVHRSLRQVAEDLKYRTRTFDLLQELPVLPALPLGHDLNQGPAELLSAPRTQRQGSALPVDTGNFEPSHVTPLALPVGLVPKSEPDFIHCGRLYGLCAYAQPPVRHLADSRA